MLHAPGLLGAAAAGVAEKAPMATTKSNASNIVAISLFISSTSCDLTRFPGWLAETTICDERLESRIRCGRQRSRAQSSPSHSSFLLGIESSSPRAVRVYEPGVRTQQAATNCSAKRHEDDHPDRKRDVEGLIFVVEDPVPEEADQPHQCPRRGAQFPGSAAEPHDDSGQERPEEHDRWERIVERRNEVQREDGYSSGDDQRGMAEPVAVDAGVGLREIHSGSLSW
jgi:hypothetical protein